MPMYDFTCASCESAVERFVPLACRNDAHVCACGGGLRRVLAAGRAPTMVPDSIPGGVVIENLTRHPKRYYSRSAIRLAQEIAEVKPFVRHMGSPGSDRSPHTTRWI